MKCNVAIEWTHQYMDGDLPKENARELKAHLLMCPECRARFEQLERTEALLHTLMKNEVSAASQTASAALTERIMGSLPKQRRRMDWTRWVRNHPAATSAALFVVVMLASFISSWDKSSAFTVTSNDLQQVVINGNTVTVPEGVSLNGDLTVSNGKVDVQGDVNGNVTVIDGSLVMASTAHIAGQTKKIDRALDWLWYKLSQTVSTIGN